MKKPNKKKAAMQQVGRSALHQIAMVGLGALANCVTIALEADPGVLQIRNASQQTLPPPRKRRASKKLQGGGQ